MSAPETILECVAALADEWKLAGLQAQIDACRRQLQSRHGIDVAVFGRFKAGKSSFLNHLTGRAVLPIGVVPLTAVITRMRHGLAERAEVRFLNGRTREIPLGEIGRYVGENENPDNEKQVASVEIELPALEPFAPLCFVDTPGLGSAFRHNTRAAMEWLPNVGAALVAVSSDAPLSERDLELIGELRRHTPQIVLLLTKADLLSRPQRAEVLDFVHQQLRRKTESEKATARKPAEDENHSAGLPVFFYSVRPEEGDLKVELEGKLLSPLARNRDTAADQIGRHKLLSLLAHTLNYLRTALAAATQADSSREALRRRLSEERRQFDLLRSEFRVFSREWSAGALDGYLARLQPIQRALQRKITLRLSEQLPLWKLRLPRMLEAWREWLDDFLKRELTDVSHAQKALFCEPLDKVRAHLTRALGAFHDRLAGHVKSALGVTLTPPEFVLEVREPSAPPVQVAYAFDAAFTSLGGFIPLSLFRKPIEGVLLRKARYEVEKNLSRLAAGWRDRVARAIDEMNREAEERAREELAALEQMLGQSTSKVPELRQAVAELEEYRNRLPGERPAHRQSMERDAGCESLRAVTG